MNFSPVLRNTFSIQKTLMELAIDRKIESKLLDFELLSHETFVKSKNSQEILINDTSTITKENLIDEEFEILQKYSIKVFSKKQNKDQKIKLKLSANKLKTKIMTNIEKGSLFDSSIDLHRELKDLIWHKKLKAGILIDIFEPFLDKQLKKLIKLVPKDKEIKKEIKMTVAIGIEPSIPVDANLQELYKQKNEDSKSIIDGVDKGELVLVYNKQKSGSNARSCTGRLIKAREPKILDPEPTIDETINKKELDDTIEYYANTNGFVDKKNNNLTISKKLNLDSSDFKPSTNIETGEDKDISVHISHSSGESEDAVKGGVNIEAKELNVDGSVGANTKIKTQELKIDAQTHKKSTLEVENTANIKLHRGDLTAKDAEIDMLESGKVKAHNSIYIKKMLGGEAIAPIVRVDELLSNCTIIASKLIEIKSIGGDNINLIIDPDSIQSYHDDLQRLTSDTKELKDYLKEKKKEFENEFKEHHSQIDRIKTFKLRILKAQKEGKKPMKQDILRIKEYKRVSLALSSTKLELEQSETRLCEMQTELEKMYEIDLHAKITCTSTYNGTQNIIFINPKNKEQVKYNPSGKIDTISLSLDSNNKRIINT